MMRVLVCGGRDFDDRVLVRRTLDALLEEHGSLTIIEGGARGADRLAYDWARDRRCRIITEAADWEKHGKAAGPIRNQTMLDEHAPNLVVAFRGGRGTEDMVRRAGKAGIAVMRVG